MPGSNLFKYTNMGLKLTYGCLLTRDLYFSHTQTKAEERIFANFKINWKFHKLISAIMEKSWPRDDQGNPQEREDTVLQHLLSWGAAWNILKLYGIRKKK